MVRQGFGLNDLKTLYIDEFKQYYNELIYCLEVGKELAEGTYDKLLGVDRTSENLSKLFSVAKANK